MRVRRESNGEVIDLGSCEGLGGGGAARLFRVGPRGVLVAKVYHQPTEAHGRKLAVMLSNAPEDPRGAEGHRAVAWPADLLRAIDGSRRVVGFLMPRVTGMRPIRDFSDPGARRLHSPLFSYRDLLRTARCLAAAVHALHSRGYVIGDINESDILVSDGCEVTLVDTDSYQVRDPRTGVVFPSPPGRPQFTPPELQSQEIAGDRTPEHDLFGLGVLLFQLLMEGTHPFAGVYTGAGRPPALAERIAAGHFPYALKSTTPYQPGPMSPSFQVLDPTLRDLFVRCFERGHTDPSARPDTRAWQAALEQAEDALRTCSMSGQHHYSGHLSACPWCERDRLRVGRGPLPLKAASAHGELPRSAPPAQAAVVPEPAPSSRAAETPRAGVSTGGSGGIGRWAAGLGAAAMVAVLLARMAHSGVEPPGRRTPRGVGKPALRQPMSRAHNRVLLAAESGEEKGKPIVRMRTRQRRGSEMAHRPLDAPWKRLTSARRPVARLAAPDVEERHRRPPSSARPAAVRPDKKEPVRHQAEVEPQVAQRDVSRPVEAPDPAAGVMERESLGRQQPHEGFRAAEERERQRRRAADEAFRIAQAAEARRRQQSEKEFRIAQEREERGRQDRE